MPQKGLSMECALSGYVADGRADGDFRIAIRCLQARMTKPRTNNVHLDSGFQKMNGGAMTPYVREDASRSAIRSVFDNLLGGTSDDLVDSESSQSLIPWSGKDGLVWSGPWFKFGKQLFEKQSRFIPEGAAPPFVPFSVQMHAWAWIESKVIRPQVRRFLYTSSRVVEEQQQGSVRNTTLAGTWSDRPNKLAA